MQDRSNPPTTIWGNRRLTGRRPPPNLRAWLNRLRDELRPTRDEYRQALQRKLDEDRDT